MSGNWSDNYDTLHGVDPSDYQYEDDFISARMSARGDFRKQEPKKEGCYIATCVYGSYDSPEVLTLRKFRDAKLKVSAPGRAFIRAYYAVSPKLVSIFGGSRLFRAACKAPLDRLVRKLER